MDFLSPEEEFLAWEEYKVWSAANDGALEEDMLSDAELADREPDFVVPAGLARRLFTMQGLIEQLGRELASVRVELRESEAVLSDLYNRRASDN